MLNVPCIDAFRDQFGRAMPARIQQNMEAAWNSIRRLSTLCDALDRCESREDIRSYRQHVISEMVVAEAYYRYLLDLLNDMRRDPLSEIGWQATMRDLERTLEHLQGRLRSQGIPWPGW